MSTIRHKQGLMGRDGISAATSQQLQLLADRIAYAADGQLRMTAPTGFELNNAARAVAEERRVSSPTWRAFGIWTALFWGAAAVFATLFFVGALDFTTSAKASLYGISIWLNGWIIPLLLPGARKRPRMALFHECLVLWMVSYVITNLLWEIPWVLFSPFVFHDLHTLNDVIAYTPWMRENVLHMYWWNLASFGSVDLRTVNHNSTFFTLELYAFVNVATGYAFWRLNKKRSSLRYLIPVLGAGEPVVATFIFSFSEVFGGFENMPGGIADTLLALVWTQYQYFVFPLVFGYLGCKLLFEDWRHTRTPRLPSSVAPPVGQASQLLLGPTVGFLADILVLAHLADDAGLFVWLGGVLGRSGWAECLAGAPTQTEFLRLGVLTVPIGLIAGVAALWLGLNVGAALQ